MKTWLLRISVALCVLACLATGGGWVWREYYSAEQFRAGMLAGEYEKAERLKRWGADTEPWRKADSAQQLQAAITADDARQVHFLIRLGAPVDADIVFSRSILKGAEVPGKPLHWAAELGHSDLVKLFLAHGAEVDDKDNLYGWTPLHEAVIMGFIDVAELLLVRGANVDAKDDDGRTPLDWSAVYRHTDIAKLLLAYGAEVDAKDNDGRMPLHFAALQAFIDIAKLLLAHGADPNSKDRKGESPLDIWPELAEIVKEVEAEKAKDGTKP